MTQTIQRKTENKSHPCVKAKRMIEAASLKAIRERVAMAKLFRYARHPKAMIFGAKALMVAFASDSFKAQEVAWLEARE